MAQVMEKSPNKNADDDDKPKMMGKALYIS